MNNKKVMRSFKKPISTRIKYQKKLRKTKDEELKNREF